MTHEPLVAAVVRARGSGAGVGATLDAVARQGHAVASTISHDGSYHDALARARAQAPEATWYWLLDAGVIPEPSALEELLAAVSTPELPVPVLVAGKVVGEHGELGEERAPWPPLLDREVVIAAARRRLVSLRLARWGSLLVAAQALEDHGLPRADYDGGADDLEWTARLLRDERGYLAPRSVSRDSGRAPGDPGLVLRDRARMIRGSGWVAQEPVWFAFMLIVDTTRRLRGRPRSAGPLLRALISPSRRR